MDAREAQREYWNTKGGERWITAEALFDAFVRPFGNAALERLAAKDGEHILDIGCGCGDTLAALSRAVGPSGSVTGIDISAPMIERAKQRVPQARALAGDAATQTFDRHFDALFSRFGVMFFAEPLVAFRHLRGLLTPEGRFSFVCWRTLAQNPWASVPGEAVLSVLPHAEGWPSGEGPGPFSLADEGALVELLADAGFSSSKLLPFETDVVLSTTGLDDAVHFALTTGTAARLLVNASDAEKALASQAIQDKLRAYLVGDRVALPAATWLVLAQA